MPTHQPSCSSAIYLSVLFRGFEAFQLFIVYNYKDDSEEVTVYSNFNDGEAVYGVEETVKNYLILSKDPSGNF